MHCMRRMAMPMIIMFKFHTASSCYFKFTNLNVQSTSCFKLSTTTVTEEMRLSATLPVHLYARISTFLLRLLTSILRILLILSSLEARVDAFDDQQSKAQIYSVAKRAHTHAPSLHHDAHTGASRIGDNSNFNLRADNDTEDVVCHPAGRCEPCPRDEVRKVLLSCFYFRH